jgi:hypothetical protein
MARRELSIATPTCPSADERGRWERFLGMPRVGAAVHQPQGPKPFSAASYQHYSAMRACVGPDKAANASQKVTDGHTAAGMIAKETGLP